MHGQQKFREKKHRRRHGKIKTDKHHVYPRSRKIDGNLDKFKPLISSLVIKTKIDRHAAWHSIFHNLFAEEAVSLVKNSFKEGSKSLPEIISFIKRSFYPRRAIPEATKTDFNNWHKILGSKKNPNCRWIKKLIFKKWTYPGVRTVVFGKKIVKVIIYLEKIPRKNRIIEKMLKCKNIRIIVLKNGTLLKLI